MKISFFFISGQILEEWHSKTEEEGLLYRIRKKHIYSTLRTLVEMQVGNFSHIQVKLIHGEKRHTSSTK